MNILPTRIAEVLVVEPTVFGDERGFFFESYNAETFGSLTGLRVAFVQDNHSHSKKNVLRGLHYQIRQAQGKLVRVVRGAVYDVAVDIRRSSPTFGAWVGEVLTAENKRQMWVPPGFAHGFLVTSEAAEVLYKTTDYYAPAYERCILWNDPDIDVRWPAVGDPLVSDKDREGVPLCRAEVFP